VIREDPLRIAHYILNIGAQYETIPKTARHNQLPPPDPAAAERELTRIRKMLPYFAKALPKPPGYVSKGVYEDIEAGMFEYAERLARNRARTYSKRVVTGSDTISNIEISGALLDYGTFGTVPNRFKAKMRKVDSPLDDPSGPLEYQLLEAVDELKKKTLPEEWRKRLLGRDAFKARFEQTRKRCRSSSG